MKNIPVTLLVIASIALVAVAPFGKKKNTVTGPRVVAELAWTAAAGPIALSSVNETDHDKAEAFMEAVDEWLVKAFEKLGYTVDASADTKFHWTLEIYDPGSAVKRWGLGFGAGTAHVQGTVTITQAGTEVGRYLFSARPQGVKGAKEVGPVLAKRIHEGTFSESLHEYEKATKAAKEGDG